MFYPQSATYELASIQWDGLAYDGVDFAAPVSFQCHAQPMSSTSAYERFGIETSTALLLICAASVAIDNFARVIIGGVTYKATQKKKYSDGLPTDHIEMMLERLHE